MARRLDDNALRELALGDASIVAIEWPHSPSFPLLRIKLERESGREVFDLAFHWVRDLKIQLDCRTFKPFTWEVGFERVSEHALLVVLDFATDGEIRFECHAAFLENRPSGIEALPTRRREALRDLVLRMLDGRLDLVDGCQAIAQYRDEARDERVAVFVAFASELDQVPSAASRPLWSPELLASSLDFLEHCRPEIVSSCRVLLEALDTTCGLATEPG